MKTLIAIIFSLISFTLSANNCFEVSFPNPDSSRGTIDMVDWMIMDAGIRNQAHKEPGAFGDILFSNKIINTKFNLAAGNNWDVWTFDNDFTYFYITGVPNTYTRAATESSNVYTLRYPVVGNPGTRIVNRCNQQIDIVDCVKTSESPIMANYITEVWGPFEHTFTGNIGYQKNVISVKYYWNCWDSSKPNGDTDNPNLCTEQEENWYVRPYGWVQWREFLNNNRDGNWVPGAPGGPFDNIEEGGPGFTLWCGYLPETIPISRIHKPIRTNPTTLFTSLEGHVLPAVWGANMQLTVTQNGENHYVTADATGFYHIDELKNGSATISYITMQLGGGSVDWNVKLHIGKNTIDIKVW